MLEPLGHTKLAGLNSIIIFLTTAMESAIYPVRHIEYDCKYRSKNTSVWVVHLASHWNSSPPGPHHALQTQVPSWQMPSTPDRVHYENSLCGWIMRILSPLITTESVTFALSTSSIPSYGWNINYRVIRSYFWQARQCWCGIIVIIILRWDIYTAIRSQIQHVCLMIMIWSRYKYVLHPY